jgi:hypothetical protein
VGGPVVSAAGIMVILSVALTFPVQMFPAAELWEIRAGLEVPIAPPLSTTSTVASNNGDDDGDDDTTANTTYSPVMTYGNNKKKEEDDDDDYAEDDEGQEEGLLEVDESINDLEDCLQHVNDDDDNDNNNQEKKMKKKTKNHHIRSQKRLEYLENKSENNLDDYRRLMLRLSLVAGCGVFAFIVKDLEQLVSVIGSVICMCVCVCVFFFLLQINIR